jgi:hypothetical protein
MRKFLKDIIGNVVNNIDQNFTVLKIENPENIGTTLYLDDLKWLKTGDTLSDNNGHFVTIGTVASNYIIVYKASPFNWTSTKVTAFKTFYYIAGTPLDVNSEWLKLSISQENKLPLFWLALPTNETYFTNGQGLERESSVRLFIIDQSLLKYTVEEYYTKVMKYLVAYLEAFKLAIHKDKLFANIDSFEEKELYRLGSENTDGFEAVILDSNLSAIELRFTLPVRKRENCIC